MYKSNVFKTGTVIALGLLLLLGAGVLGFMLAWPIQWLWNNTLVNAIDGVHPISFWQAYGIFLLVNLITASNINLSSKNK